MRTLGQSLRSTTNPFLDTEFRSELGKQRLWGNGLCRESQFSVQRFVRVRDTRVVDTSNVDEVITRNWPSVTPTDPVDASGGYRFNRPTKQEILALGTPEELTRLVTNRTSKSEGARDSSNFT